jgi:hypothetical protein
MGFIFGGASDFNQDISGWNTITPYGDISDDFFCELIDHSYDLVVSGLTKKLIYHRIRYLLPFL